MVILAYISNAIPIVDGNVQIALHPIQDEYIIHTVPRVLRPLHNRHFTGLEGPLIVGLIPKSAKIVFVFNIYNYHRHKENARRRFTHQSNS